MVRFAGGLACRRRQVLRYFGEEYGADNCGNCDVCLGARESVDISEDARKVLSAVYRTGQRFGAVHVVDVDENFSHGTSSLLLAKYEGREASRALRLR